MTQQTDLTLDTWLKSLPNVIADSVTLVKINGLGRVTYLGARYDVGREDGSIDTRYYVLGNVPSFYRRSRRVCFTANLHQPHEMYIGGWVNDTTAIDPRFAQFHPFGASFMMFIWKQDQPIDYGDFRQYNGVEIPYKRRAITITDMA